MILILFEKHKLLKNKLNEELMEIVWHAKRCQKVCITVCMSENEKKRNRTNFYWVMLLVWIQFESIETFCHLI